MNGLHLQDRIYSASGRAAARIGLPCDLYRPTGPDHPTHQSNFRLRLNVIFLPLGGHTRRPAPAANPLWEAALDAAYTKPGDILLRRTDREIYFIAAQQPLLPVLCVRSPHRITIKRPASASYPGVNIYGGTVAALETIIAKDWPAAILAAGGQSTGLASLPAELNPGMWQVLLPSSLDIALLPTDIVTDDRGRAGVIASIETTEYGSRLTVKQASA
jgi:hypothetical protein